MAPSSGMKLDLDRVRAREHPRAAAPGGLHEALLGTALALHRQGPDRARREGAPVRARRGGLEPRAPLRAAPPGRGGAEPEETGAGARGWRRGRLRLDADLRVPRGAPPRAAPLPA